MDGDCLERDISKRRSRSGANGVIKSPDDGSFSSWIMAGQRGGSESLRSARGDNGTRPLSSWTASNTPAFTSTRDPTTEEASKMGPASSRSTRSSFADEIAFLPVHSPGSAQKLSWTPELDSPVLNGSFPSPSDQGRMNNSSLNSSRGDPPFTSSATPDDSPGGSGSPVKVVRFDHRKPQLVGVGAHFEQSGGEVKVLRLIPRGSAATCGQINVGDILISVNGSEIEGKPMDHLAKLVLGLEGTMVELGMLRDGSRKAYTVALVRSRVLDQPTRPDDRQLHLVR